MKEAKLKSDINRIRVAGTSITMLNTDFVLYKDGVLDVVNRQSDEYFKILDYMVS